MSSFYTWKNYIIRRLSHYTYIYTCVCVCVCEKLGSSLSFKHVWLNNKDTFYLHNFIRILSCFLALGSSWKMNLLGPFIGYHQRLFASVNIVFSKVYGPPYMAVQKQDDQHEHTFSSYVRIRDVVLKTYLGRWTIGRSGERGPGISVLSARYDDDDDNIAKIT